MEEVLGLRTVERRFSPKDTIFAPGDPDDQLYFLLSGTVRLYKIYGDFKEATTALLKDGGIFGKLNLVEGRWQNVFAEAVTESRVASIQNRGSPSGASRPATWRCTSARSVSCTARLRRSRP